MTTARARSISWFLILIVSAIVCIAPGARAEGAPDRTVLPLAVRAIGRSQNSMSARRLPRRDSRSKRRMGRPMCS